LLTEVEEQALVKWVVAKNKAQIAVGREDIRHKARHIVLARRVQNRKGGRKRVTFNYAAYKVLCGKLPSGKFFTGLLARHSHKFSFKTKQKLEDKRAKVNCEAMIEERFEGIHGLRAELRDTGIMDESGIIIDPKRVLNMDETPQFVDYADNKGNAKKKFAAGVNDICVSAETINRECNSVMMCWGLDGSNYGLQFIVGRQTITESLTPDELSHFKNEVLDDFKCSTFGMISNTEHGVQTEAFFFERMKMLDAELALRKVVRPVVVMSDNHASRKGTDCFEWCFARGLRLFFESSNTSGFLQALDQCNKKFHEACKKEKDLMNKGIGNRTLNTADQLKILVTIWPFWCNPTDRINAFSKVGIEQTHLAPDNVDRSKFIMHSPPPVGKTDEVDLTITSPALIEKDTAEYFKAKLERAEAIIKLQSEREVDPKEAGILEVTYPIRKVESSRVRITIEKGTAEYFKAKLERAEAIIKLQSEREVDPKEAGILEVTYPIRKVESSRVCITDGHGSALLSDILGKRKAQEAARATVAEAKRQRAEMRTQKHAEKHADFARLLPPGPDARTDVSARTSRC